MEFDANNYNCDFACLNTLNSQNTGEPVCQKFANKETSNSIYDEFNTWQQDSYNLALSGKSDEIDGFDFVNSDISYEDTDFTELYKQKLYELAEANLNASDTDNSNGISYEEYITQELESCNEMFPEEAVDFDSSTGKITGEFADEYNEYFQSSFKVLDVNEDNEINLNEIAAFYATADSMDSTGGSADGKIQFDTLLNLDIATEAFQNSYSNALNETKNDN